MAGGLPLQGQGGPRCSSEWGRPQLKVEGWKRSFPGPHARARGLARYQPRAPAVRVRVPSTSLAMRNACLFLSLQHSARAMGSCSSPHLLAGGRHACGTSPA
eukprot:scaffold317_cov101-Isochrysis_galbana.AAC.2